MEEQTKILLSEFKHEYDNYKTYIDANDWHDDVEMNSKGKYESSKLTTEISIIDTILKSISKFKDDVGEDIDKKPVQEFVKYTIQIVNKHIDRIAKYKKHFPIDSDSGESEIEFHSDLFGLITKTKIALSRLKIDENELSKVSIDLFYGGSKAPLLMREYLSEQFPIIKDKTANIGLDFSVAHINPATSNELLINMKAKDIPPWDPKKHFFEQEKSTIQFWEEEKNKIRNGLNIGGYHLSSWLYWHTNIFKLSYGAGEDKDIKVALFRDNEFFFDHMERKAHKHGRQGLFLYGTRRYAKSVGMASKLLHGMYTIKNAQGTIQGFSKVPDLEALVSYASAAIQNMYPALAIPANNLTIDDGITLGIKGKKVQDRYDFANLTIINLEGGNTKKGGQKTAGSTPDIFLLDEAGKGKCLVPWNAAKPSFGGGKKGRWRLVPLLSGTAGEKTLSEDAEAMLKNPELHGILPMDWDFLEEFVDPDYVTWKRNNFGFFVPAQMSLDAPDKIEMGFGDFLGMEGNDELNKITIHATDWEQGKLFYEGKREKASSDINALASETNSFPLDPEDCYITSEINIFPGMECKFRKSYVESEGLTGEKYRLFRSSTGEIHTELSTDQVVTEYPYKGGSIDAPVVMLENPTLQPELPPLGLYIIGFDDAKQDKSDGDSLLSATVYKRGFEGGEWANRIVGWYDSRPERKKDYYKTLHLLMKIYNARLLHENADNGFVEHLETNHQEDLFIHVSNGIGLATEENLNRNKNRSWGWSPTTTNIYHANQRVVRYTKEENVVIGAREDFSGVDRINHPMLLEELYKYKKDANADRLRSFSLALTLANYYDNSYQYLKKRRPIRAEGDSGRPKLRQVGSRGLTDTSRIKKY